MCVCAWVSLFLQNHSHIFSSENLQRRPKNSNSNNQSRSAIVAQSQLHSWGVSVSSGEGVRRPTSWQSRQHGSHVNHSAGRRFLWLSQWEVSESKPMCFKQKLISKFPTLAHQSDEGPAHVVNLSACPLPTSPCVGHCGSRKNLLLQL